MKLLAKSAVKNLEKEFTKIQSHDEFVERIRRSLYFSNVSAASLPLTEILVDNFHNLCKQDCIDTLNIYEASFICYNVCVTPCSVIIALLYLERLKQNADYLNSTSSPEVFLMSLMIASKFLYETEEDEPLNAEWAASSADMAISDLNHAEKKFLQAIDWNLFVRTESFSELLVQIEYLVAMKESSNRNYFTYSDLVSISRLIEETKWISVIKLIGSAFTVCILSYTVSIIIIIAGGFIAYESSTRGVNIYEKLQAKTRLPADSETVAKFGNNRCAILNDEVRVDFENINVEEPKVQNHDDSILSRRCKKKFLFRTIAAAVLLSTSKIVGNFARAGMVDLGASERLDPGPNFSEDLNASEGLGLRINFNGAVNCFTGTKYEESILEHLGHHRNSKFKEMRVNDLENNDSRPNFYDLNYFTRRSSDRTTNLNRKQTNPLCFSQSSDNLFRRPNVCTKICSGIKQSKTFNLYNDLEDLNDNLKERKFLNFKYGKLKVSRKTKINLNRVSDLHDRISNARDRIHADSAVKQPRKCAKSGGSYFLNKKYRIPFVPHFANFDHDKPCDIGFHVGSEIDFPGKPGIFTNFHSGLAWDFFTDLQVSFGIFTDFHNITGIFTDFQSNPGIHNDFQCNPQIFTYSNQCTTSISADFQDHPGVFSS